jgi:hypothetical protein
MEAVENQKAGFPPLPQALEIPPGFPHSRGPATAN